MNTLLQLAANNTDQHASGGYGVGAIVLVCVVIWILTSGGGGPKKK